jgi:hypothetical protein
VPDKVLGQLGNRVQHALRAFTPRDQKAVAAAAQTFRPNPKLNTAQVITELAKGEALVSFLEGNGTPAMVERAMVRPPAGRIGPITTEERTKIQANSPVKGKYDTAVEAESAYEKLQQRTQDTAHPGTPGAPGAPQDGAPASGGWLGGIGGMLGGIFGTSTPRNKRLTTGQVMARDITRTVTNRVAGQIAADIGKSIGGSMGGSVGRAIVRGALGGILRR